jgi:hypothetical protein
MPTDKQSPQPTLPAPAVDAGPDAIPSTAPLLTGPKRQHFLPKFYLEGFADKKGVVAVFDRKENQVRVQQPINTGVIGHFYTFEDDQGRQRFEYEKMLSDIEGKASLVIKKLAAKDSVSPEERADMAIFVALAMFRTPDMVDSLKQSHSGFIGQLTKQLLGNVEQVMVQMRGMPDAPTSEAELEKRAQEMVDFVKGGQYRLETDHQWAIGTAFRQAMNVAPVLEQRHWDVTHRADDSKSYVTSDAPVVLTTLVPRPPSPYDGVGFANSDALVYFPLCASSGLVMHGNTGGLAHRTVGAEQMRHTNLGVADRCQRFVVGRDEALVSSLAARLNLADKEWVPKMQAS